MRSSSLARVVMVTLGVSVVITLGCGGSPSGPTPPPQASFSVRSIWPNDGSSAAPTVATIGGTGFQAGATVTVDGSRVDATVINATSISVTMPAHAAGKVNVIVINPLSQAQAVPGGFYYLGPPVISELVPNIGSTAGGAQVAIRGTGVGYAVTVTVGGIVTPFDQGIGGFVDDPIVLSMPAHAAGTVEVIVTDRFGQTARGVFTYASPATLDFNGDWQATAFADNQWPALLALTIRDNIVVSVTCSVCRDQICAIVSAPSLTLAPPPVVANGEFSYAGSDGVSVTGKIVSPTYATGSINTPSCGSRQWEAYKK